ncbi:hypothetical protein HMPREF1870_01858 [Bacteroidales bacterium KA00344]|nr:hypothetical protein HMPREF1870_01858 [Bacteroidales bacterium KA00344]
MFRFPIDGNGKVVVSGGMARTTVVSGRHLYILRRERCAEKV